LHLFSKNITASPYIGLMILPDDREKAHPLCQTTSEVSFKVEISQWPYNTM